MIPEKEIGPAFCRAAERLSRLSGGFFRKWENGRIDIELDGISLAELASCIWWEIMMPNATVKGVLEAAKERLRTARFGLEDMGKPDRGRSGLYNAVVFGRMVTFALQNLRGVVPDFDDWYAQKQEELRTDPLMKFFSDLRTEIEKKTDVHTGLKIVVHKFSNDDLKRFEPAPPNAIRFFIGDRNGGGWLGYTSAGRYDRTLLCRFASRHWECRYPPFQRSGRS